VRSHVKLASTDRLYTE